MLDSEHGGRTERKMFTSFLRVSTLVGLARIEGSVSDERTVEQCNRVV